jgi:hypothetical protein
VVSDKIPARVRAIEREAQARTYVFDILVEDPNGECIQRWEKAVFRALNDIDPTPGLLAQPALFVPYLERMVREAFQDDSVEVAFVRDQRSGRDGRRRIALAQLGMEDVDHRADGAPMRSRGTGSISIAHRQDFTMVVAARARIGCDVETPQEGITARHTVATEACRKLGRRVVLDPAGELPSGRVVRIEDMVLLTLDLPTVLGVQSVAFSRIAQGEGEWTTN